ncbi:MAG: beta-1,6-N-acetylglucosaminyltransferase [Acidobacteriia bacterium]|nr:beta-1,6-N-acetylglucosaminyltransferase [Terriglobia bacterium]
MRLAYLVFAYKNPRLLEKTIAALSFQDSQFFVHIDRKSSIKEFARMRQANVLFAEERIPVQWAEFSGVEAILQLIRQALAAGQEFDYLVLLSGSEYPLRSARYIQSFFGLNPEAEYINVTRVPNERAGKPLARINSVYPPSSKPVRRFVARSAARFGFGQRDYRDYLGGLEPYAGSTWWALTKRACEYIVTFMERNPGVVEFFREVFAPEEALVHTILGNSSFASRIRRNVLYEDWSAGGAHPAYIDLHHLRRFEVGRGVYLSDVYGSGEMLFARKFSDESLSLLVRMDEIALAKGDALALA